MLRFASASTLTKATTLSSRELLVMARPTLPALWAMQPCRRFKKVQYIRMPELLDELSIARSGGTLKKVLESYKKKDLLILDEWLIRPLSPQESYDMLEIVEARCHKSTIFCTQYKSEGWYTRIDPSMPPCSFTNSSRCINCNTSRISASSTSLPQIRFSLIVPSKRKGCCAT